LNVVFCVRLQISVQVPARTKISQLLIAGVSPSKTELRMFEMSHLAIEALCAHIFCFGMLRYQDVLNFLGCICPPTFIIYLSYQFNQGRDLLMKWILSNLTSTNPDDATANCSEDGATFSKNEHLEVEGTSTGDSPSTMEEDEDHFVRMYVRTESELVRD
jgi:hypothetical protein